VSVLDTQPSRQEPEGDDLVTESETESEAEPATAEAESIIAELEDVQPGASGNQDGSQESAYEASSCHGPGPDTMPSPPVSATLGPYWQW